MAARMETESESEIQKEEDARGKEKKRMRSGNNTESDESDVECKYTVGIKAFKQVKWMAYSRIDTVFQCLWGRKQERLNQSESPEVELLQLNDRKANVTGSTQHFEV